MKKIFSVLKDEYGVSPDATATVFITLMVFAFGLLVTALSNSLVARYRKTSYRKAHRIIMRDFFSACKKQSRYHTESLAQRGMLHGEDFSIKISVNPSLPYLQQMNKGEFILRFRRVCRKGSIRAISKFFEIVEFIRLNDDILQRGFASYADMYMQYGREYRSSLNQLRVLNDKCIEVVLFGNGNEFHGQYTSIFKDWKDIGNKTSDGTYNSIVKPSLTLARNSLPSEVSQQVVNSALSCEVAFQNMQKMQAEMIALVKQASYANRRAYKVGEVILNRL